MDPGVSVLYSPISRVLNLILASAPGWDPGCNEGWSNKGFPVFSRVYVYRRLFDTQHGSKLLGMVKTKMNTKTFGTGNVKVPC